MILSNLEIAVLFPWHLAVENIFTDQFFVKKDKIGQEKNLALIWPPDRIELSIQKWADYPLMEPYLKFVCKRFVICT